MNSARGSYVGDGRFGHSRPKLNLAADVRFIAGSDRISDFAFRQLRANSNRSGKPAPPYTIAA
jgi:hypothetical protein